MRTNCAGKARLVAACLPLIGGILIFCGTSRAGAAEASGRDTQNFDHGWRFLAADAAGAEKPEFDTAAWRKLDVPHDWSIEGPFAETNGTGGAGGFLPAGIGWYRKEFTLAKDGRRAFIEFDGVMANSD